MQEYFQLSREIIGQAAATLHSMGVLQAYQAELLKELDKGEGLTPPEAVKEGRVDA